MKILILVLLILGNFSTYAMTDEGPYSPLHRSEQSSDDLSRQMRTLSLAEDQKDMETDQKKLERLARDMPLVYAAIRSEKTENNKTLQTLVSERKCANLLYRRLIRFDTSFQSKEPESPIWVATRLAVQDKDKKEVVAKRYEDIKILLSVGKRQKNNDEEEEKTLTWGDFEPNYYITLRLSADYELRPLRTGLFFGCIPTGLIKGGLTHFAAQNNAVELLKIFKTHGFDIEALDESGWSPIMYAAAAGAVDAFNYLLNECAVMWEYCNNCTHISGIALSPAIRTAMKSKTKDDCCAGVFCCFWCL